MLRLSILLLLLPTIAFGLEIPPGCQELADREGFSNIVGKVQEAKARARYEYLKIKTPKDPLLMQCKENIAAIKAMKK